MRVIFFLLLLVSIFSCSSNSDATVESIPKEVLDSNTFAKVLVDIHLMDAGAKFQIYPDNRKVHNKYSAYMGVLKKHNISKAQWDSTLTYYTSHPQKFENTYNRVLELFSEQNALLKGKFDTTKVK